MNYTAFPKHGQTPGVAEDPVLFSHGDVTDICWAYGPLEPGCSCLGISMKLECRRLCTELLRSSTPSAKHMAKAMPVPSCTTPRDSFGGQKADQFGRRGKLSPWQS